MSLLLSEATVGGLQLKNRIGMSPMCTYAVEKGDGVLTPFHFAHYFMRAVGQVGLITTESTAMEPDGRISQHDLGLWNDTQRDALKQLTDLIHTTGTKFGVQLSHAGRKAEDVATPLSSTDEPFSEDYNAPRMLSTDEVHGLVDKFQAAAKRAADAGVDVIEVHGAHGYLLNQFLEPATNKRTDEYGGSFENRTRLLREVVQAVQSVFNGPVWVRLSVSAYLPEGEQNSLDEWIALGRELESLGVKAVDVSTGGVAHATPNIEVTDGYQVPFAQAFKERTNLDVAAIGLLHDPKLAEQVLQDGKADLILQGRALLRSPNWPADAALALHEPFHYYNDSYARGYEIFN